MSEVVFSVAIITYNQEGYISQTLDSIIDQEHHYSYEIVIGDDCSSDNTSNIIIDYCNKYPTIIKPLLNNKNMGVINNYYNVLSMCKGKYIMECAGDDYWLPGKVAAQIKYMDEHIDIGMCYGRTLMYRDDIKKITRKCFGSKKETVCELYSGNDIPALSVCIRHDLINKYIEEVKPVEKQWIMEDYPMWIWFAYNSKIKYLPQIFGVYRVLNESISHSKDLSKMLICFRSTNDIKKYYACLYQLHNIYKDETNKYLLLYYLKRMDRLSIAHIDTHNLAFVYKVIVYSAKSNLFFLPILFCYSVYKKFGR
jgi:glycosyltransferase involved in cell wall biosynthesis